jgi:hypothetical protein
MALIQADSANTNRELTVLDYKPNGELKSADAEVALVVSSTSKAEAFLANKQYGLLWRDSDLLFQSPRPLSVFENTYILCRTAWGCLNPL